jgi:hypothetical protein
VIFQDYNIIKYFIMISIWLVSFVILCILFHACENIILERVIPHCQRVPRLTNDEHTGLDLELSSSLDLFFSSVLEFELRALHLLGRYSTTWSMPPFCFSYFSDEISYFCLGSASDLNLLNYVSRIDGLL